MTLFLLFLAHLVVVGFFLALGVKVHVAWVGASALIAFSSAAYRLVRREPLGLPSFAWPISTIYCSGEDEGSKRHQYFGINPSTNLPMDNPFIDIGGNTFGSDSHINRE